MEKLSREDEERIAAAIRQKYAQVAVSPAGCFRYPTGRAGLEALHYPAPFLRELPEQVAGSFCGVGNPFSLGRISSGDTVLDLGCGAGVDAILAATLTGPQGRVIGIDLVPEMLARARENARLMGLGNLLFLVATASRLPVPENLFDAVISNGAFNLVVDKVTALAEVFRVLKPGSWFWVADQVLTGEPPPGPEARVANWAR
ncbi:MAG: methyltransferase domain-containing protein [Syntrophobacterales bacterium]|nr:methyltransferase domain-containing protein [Syntrophobacterales bacterium]